jgi:imidazoleglycerol-phosphate dehydratase
MNRTAETERRTRETEVHVCLNLDGSGQASVESGLPFFDHMLGAFARHGLFDLTLSARGDLDVDAHHTMEDTGLVLGQALRQALGDRSGITRFGAAVVPMDDALVRVALDISGRPYLAYRVTAPRDSVAGIPLCLFREFYRALVTAAGLTLHIDLLSGDEEHHIMEGVFKAFGRALDQGTRPDPRVTGVPSTKGALD